jgi:GNAT superfamily N-acetyltransferase
MKTIKQGLKSLLIGLLQIIASMTGLFIASRPLTVWLGSLFNIPGPHPYYAGIPLALLVMDFVIGLGLVVTALALAGQRCYRMLAGFVTVKVHNPYAAEILVMGIWTEYHRMGIGRALVLACEQFLKTQSVLFLLVKTLSSLRPDERYARTRAFYFVMGFRLLEELSGSGIWKIPVCRW